MEFKNRTLGIILLCAPLVVYGKCKETSPVLNSPEELKTYLKTNGNFYNLEYTPTKADNPNAITLQCTSNDGLKKKDIVNIATTKLQPTLPAPSVVGYLWKLLFGEDKSTPQYQVEREYEQGKLFWFIPYQENLRVKIVNQGFRKPGIENVDGHEATTTK